jgi:hypothetical protein
MFWGRVPQCRSSESRRQPLQLGGIKHAALKTLKVEAGGLRGLVHEIGAADLPALEHLEIWLGTENYGGDSRPQDLAGILDGKRFPKLVTLALRNCEWADDLAAAVATAPILNRIKRLDLSMGTLSDVSVDALVASPAVRDLQHINRAPLRIGRRRRGEAHRARDRREAKDAAARSYGGEEHRYIAVSPSERRRMPARARCLGSVRPSSWAQRAITRRWLSGSTGSVRPAPAVL